MMILEDGITGELGRIEHELQRLTQMKITIGIQGVAGKNMNGEDVAATADIMTIAGVHEFGAIIKAKNVRNLAIPIARKAVGKSPRDFDNLFFVRSKEGFLFACISSKERETAPRVPSRPSNKKPKPMKSRNKLKLPEDDEDIEYLFILFESVEIPERSFIRAGYDSGKGTIEESIQEAYEKVIKEGWDAEKAANHVGMVARDCIVGYMMDASHFKGKGAITKSTQNSSWHNSPLVDTARMRNSITYVIKEGQG